MDIEGIAGGRGGREELITKTEEKLSLGNTWPHPRLPRGPGCRGKFGVCSGRCRCDLVAVPSLALAPCRARRRHQEFLGVQILTRKSSWIRAGKGTLNRRGGTGTLGTLRHPGNSCPRVVGQERSSRGAE